MARELGDVLHWFLDGPEPEPRPAPPRRRGAVLGLVAAAKDVLRAAFAWNLAAALAEDGGAAQLVVPAPGDGEVRWPRAGAARVVPVPDPGLEPLARAAQAASRRGGPVLACAPLEDLGDAAAAQLGPRWLLFATPDEIEAGTTRALLATLVRRRPDLEPGVTLHGVDGVTTARRAFERLAADVEHELARPLRSYGLLLDDLDVYRSVVDRTPLVRGRPDARAARAIRDVAGWIRRDLAGERP